MMFCLKFFFLTLLLLFKFIQAGNPLEGFQASGQGIRVSSEVGLIKNLVLHFLFRSHAFLFSYCDLKE